MKYLASLAFLFFPMHFAVKREERGLAAAARIPPSCYGDSEPSTPARTQRNSKLALETGATTRSGQLLELREEMRDTCRGRGSCPRKQTHVSKKERPEGPWGKAAARRDGDTQASKGVDRPQRQPTEGMGLEVGLFIHSFIHPFIYPITSMH